MLDRVRWSRRRSLGLTVGAVLALVVGAVVYEWVTGLLLAGIVAIGLVVAFWADDWSRAPRRGH